MTDGPHLGLSAPQMRDKCSVALLPTHGVVGIRAGGDDQVLALHHAVSEVFGERSLLVGPVALPSLGPFNGVWGSVQVLKRQHVRIGSYHVAVTSCLNRLWQNMIRSKAALQRGKNEEHDDAKVRGQGAGNRLGVYGCTTYGRC